MHPLISTTLAVGAAGAWLVARQRRQSAERLAAATLEALLNAIDANDAVTGAHVRRVAAYSLVLAEALGLDEDARRSIERVALFHDVGKIHAALFDIVHDDDALTPTERAAIATHAQRGADVLAPLCGFYPELGEGVLAHHERWDGKGYPRGLGGCDIPLAARIVAIADTFDAITHARRYRSGASAERGERAIAEGRGTQFDPELADLFLSETVRARVEAERVAAARRATRGPRRADADADRRRRRQESSVPSVSFRWRETAPIEGDAVEVPPSAAAPRHAGAGREARTAAAPGA